MITKIGINIITKTAQEQDRLIGLRECRTYYEDPYNSSIKPSAKKIIRKFTDCYFEIQIDAHYLTDGSILNAIIFVFYNYEGIQKKQLREGLKRCVYKIWDKSKPE